MRVIIVLCLLLTGPLPRAPAQAADEAVCQDFAMKMLAYAKTNALRHCTGMGPQWSPRPAEHLSWCQKATNDAAKARLADSKSFIDKCLTTGIGGQAAPAGGPPSPGPAPAPKPPAVDKTGAVESSLPERTFP